MPRPCKCRHIACQPQCTYFKPRGIPLAALDEVQLKADEFEAVRLSDLEGLYQEEAARKMQVSRQTFGNIILTAHKKIADAIVNGKAIKIEGKDGDFSRPVDKQKPVHAVGPCCRKRRQEKETP